MGDQGENLAYPFDKLMAVKPVERPPFACPKSGKERPKRKSLPFVVGAYTIVD
jgi:hypothetical protein